MQKHTKIYMDYFGYDISDTILCEICLKPANDLHHVERRGMGGSEKKDTVDNLMALCRPDHIKFGDKKQHMDYLIDIHRKFMEENGK